MILYFLRHGLAGDRESWQEDDALRPLTAKGKKNLKKTAERLVDLGVEVDMILTSPLVRAVQTAEIIATQNGMLNRLTTEKLLAPGFNLESLGTLLHAYPQAQALLLVGHEPDFSHTIGGLIGGGELVIKKGSLIRVDLLTTTPLHGVLVWSLPPKLLAG